MVSIWHMLKDANPPYKWEINYRGQSSLCPRNRVRRSALL